MSCRAAVRSKSQRLLRELTHPRDARTASSCRSPPTRPTSTPSPPTSRRSMPGSRDIERRIKSLVRWNAAGDGGAREQGGRRHRRPHLDLRLGGDAVRSRLQSLLPRPRRAATATSSTSRATPRPASTRAPSSKAGFDETQLENFRRELKRRRRAVVVSASVADARLLGVPDGVDGPRPDHGDLPGALQALPRRSRPEADVEREGLGVPRRRRDRRARSRSARSRCRRARSSTT